MKVDTGLYGNGCECATKGIVTRRSPSTFVLDARLEVVGEESAINLKTAAASSGEGIGDREIEKLAKGEGEDNVRERDKIGREGKGRQPGMGRRCYLEASPFSFGGQGGAERRRENAGERTLIVFGNTISEKTHNLLGGWKPIGFKCRTRANYELMTVSDII